MIVPACASPTATLQLRMFAWTLIFSIGVAEFYIRGGGDGLTKSAGLYAPQSPEKSKVKQKGSEFHHES